jgi:hypothetical protein
VHCIRQHGHTTRGGAAASPGHGFCFRGLHCSSKRSFGPLPRDECGQVLHRHHVAASAEWVRGGRWSRHTNDPRILRAGELGRDAAATAPDSAGAWPDSFLPLSTSASSQRDFCQARIARICQGTHSITIPSLAVSLIVSQKTCTTGPCNDGIRSLAQPCMPYAAATVCGVYRYACCE